MKTMLYFGIAGLLFFGGLAHAEETEADTNSIEDICRQDAESSGISEDEMETYVQDCIERLQQEENTANNYDY